MFDKEFIEGLKRTGVSHNPELTLKRVNAAWDRASLGNQQEILSLASAPYYTMYRVRKTGAITAKVALAIAQVLNIDPYYIVGDTDINSGYSEETAEKFLTELGYGEAIQSYHQARPGTWTETEKADAPAVAAPTEEPATAAIIPELSTQAAMQTLREEEMITLFRGLMIKAGLGKPQAVDAMIKITEMLLS